MKKVTPILVVLLVLLLSSQPPMVSSASPRKQSSSPKPSSLNETFKLVDSLKKLSADIKSNQEDTQLRLELVETQQKLLSN